MIKLYICDRTGQQYNKKRHPKEALRKEVPPSAFVISRNDWIVGKINHIGRLQNGKVHLQREKRTLV